MPARCRPAARVFVTFLISGFHLVPGLLLALLFMPAPASATTFQVTPGGPLTIQAAIDAAADGDTILLVGTPTTPFAGPGNRDIDVRGKALVISGIGSDPVIDCEGAGEHPHQGFVLQHGEGPSTVIEHLTVIRAQSGLSQSGGAVLCMGSSPQILSCRFDDNHVSGVGSAIFSLDGSPHVADCVAEHGSASYGTPPMYMGAIICLNGSPVIENCTVRSNASGGISTGGNGTPLVRSCLMEANLFGGFSGSGTLESCTIRGNSFGSSFNAVRLFGGAATLRDCLISGNGGYYPVMHADGESVRLERCVIDGNSGGVIVQTTGDLDHCIITGNGNTPSFVYFGGLQVVGPYACHVTSCTIADNVSSAGAGGISIANASVEISHSIVQGNCSSQGSDVLVNEGGSAAFFCSDFDAGQISGAWTDRGSNLDTDARFCDPFPCAQAPVTGGDYHLDASSACRPEASPCGELIGALGVGCGVTATQPATWGAVKEMFR